MVALESFTIHLDATNDPNFTGSSSTVCRLVQSLWCCGSMSSGGSPTNVSGNSCYTRFKSISAARERMHQTFVYSIPTLSAQGASKYIATSHVVVDNTRTNLFRVYISLAGRGNGATRAVRASADTASSSLYCCGIRASDRVVPSTHLRRVHPVHTRHHQARISLRGALAGAARPVPPTAVAVHSRHLSKPKDTRKLSGGRLVMPFYTFKV